jgi:HlyD family secretion protein
MHRPNARIILTGAVILIVILLVIAFRPAPAPVQTATVTRGPLQAIVEEQGKTRVRQDYVISAPVSGRLSRVSFQEGDLVRAGMLVAQIDDLPLRSAIAADAARLAEIAGQTSGVQTQRPKPEAIAQAEDEVRSASAARSAKQAAVTAAQAQYDQATRDWKRARTLLDSGAISRSQYESAQLEQTAAESQRNVAIKDALAADAAVSSARNALGEQLAKQSDPDYLFTVYGSQAAGVQADLRRLQDDLAHTRMYAPVTGKVMRVLQKSEDYVTAGTPIMDVGDPGNLEFVVDLLTTAAMDVHPGDPIIIDDGSDSWKFQGRVRYVEPSGFTKVSALGVEEQRVNVIGDFIGSHRGFGDAYRIEARIVTWSSTDALQVPIPALYRCGDAWCAFEVERGRARQVTVVVGHFGQSNAEVLSGLSEGAEVVSYPSDQISDGTRVRSL